MGCATKIQIRINRSGSSILVVFMHIFLCVILYSCAISSYMYTSIRYAYGRVLRNFFLLKTAALNPKKWRNVQMTWEGYFFHSSVSHFSTDCFHRRTQIGLAPCIPIFRGSYITATAFIYPFFFCLRDTLRRFFFYLARTIDCFAVCPPFFSFFLFFSPSLLFFCQVPHYIVLVHMDGEFTLHFTVFLS